MNTLAGDQDDPRNLYVFKYSTRMWMGEILEMVLLKMIHDENAMNIF